MEFNYYIITKTGFFSKRQPHIPSNSYTMHAKAASARARGRELITTDAAFACMVQLIRDIQYYVTGIGNAIEIPVAILARLVPMLVVNFGVRVRKVGGLETVGGVLSCFKLAEELHHSWRVSW